MIFFATANLSMHSTWLKCHTRSQGSARLSLKISLKMHQDSAGLYTICRVVEYRHLLYLKNEYFASLVEILQLSFILGVNDSHFT